MFTLITRDGSRVGNGIVYGIEKGCFLVETDFGNVMTLTIDELNELFKIGKEQSYKEWAHDRDILRKSKETPRYVGPAQCRTCRVPFIPGVSASYEGRCIYCWQKEQEKS